MGSQENFALRWNDFHSNIETLFKHLRSASEFQDVSLVCGLEEGEVKAHKVILSSCSGYFQSILSRTSAPHPVIVMPKDVHLDDISGIVDFMYYGEVAVPTADISRFLAVAEQFQVRGLVEDVPKLGAVSSSRYQTKRPRMTEEDEHEDDEDLCEEEDEDGGFMFRAPAPEPSSMVGLVCPRCRSICRDPTELKQCMASCGSGQRRPVQTVAPAMRGHRQPQHPQQALKPQQPLKPQHPQHRVRPQAVTRGRGGIRGGLNIPQPPHQRVLGRKPQEMSQERPQQPLQPQQQRSQQPMQPQHRPQQQNRMPQQTPQPGPSKVKKSPPESAEGGKPNLQKIGQKLGLAVSITSVGEKAKKMSGEDVKEEQEQDKQESVNIKTEPDEVQEMSQPPAPEDQDGGHDHDDGDPEPPEADQGYEAQFDDGFDLGEDYVGTEDNYPAYDDYDEAEADETSKN